MRYNKFDNKRKVVYYYWSDIIENNNKYSNKKFYRSLWIETVYLDDNLLLYRNNIIKNFRNVLSIIEELKYLPPTKIGRFNYKGGYLYHKSKKNFEEKILN